ncbi:MAG: GNAT family N-acetyltransferase [bacterium]
MHVALATGADLPTLHAVYAAGRAMQRERGEAVWPTFTDAAIHAEIDAGNLFCVVDGDVLAGVFSVAYEDAAIWGEHEQNAHIYLHRITRAPGFAGRGLLNTVFAWAREQCLSLGRRGIRMDTWGDNQALITYYEGLGFRLVERRRLAEDPRLSPHYHGNEFALLAFDIVP